MGIVYTAEQAHPRRLVALKVIRPTLATPDVVRRFRREAEVLARLEHPGIARVYEANTADVGCGQQPFLAMELVKGLPLLTHLASNDLILREKLELIARVCDAVDYAHDRGVIHRDLKPSNIMVDASGKPKILDFGVARVAQADVQTVAPETDSGALIGTVAYMSPEQAAGDVRHIDARSDVYALGVITYELVTGRHPFDLQGKSLYDAVRIVREQDVPSLAAAPDRRLRGDVATIISKAVEKNPARRYGSAAELAADIRRHLAHHPIAARPQSVGYVLAKWSRRNRRGIGRATAAALVALLSTAWIISDRRAATLAEVRDLTRALDRQLARVGEWSPEAYQTTVALVTRVSQLSPADGHSAGTRLSAAMTDQADRAIRAARTPSAVEHARRQLDLLAMRDAVAAGRLRQALDARTAAKAAEPAHARADASAATAQRPVAAKAAPQPAAGALDDELLRMNGKAWLLRSEGRIAEAAELRRTVLERAKVMHGATHEGVIDITLSYAGLLGELQRHDEADEVLRATKDLLGHGPAAERVGKALSRLHRQREQLTTAATAAKPPATRPADRHPPEPPAQAKEGLAAAPSSPVPAAATAARNTETAAAGADPDLKFVDKAIDLTRYADAEARLFEMYLESLERGGDPQRNGRILLAAARVYTAWGRPELARVHADRAARPTSAAPGARAAIDDTASKLEWLDAMNRLAHSMRLNGRLELAKAVRRRVLLEAKPMLPASDPRLITFQINCADLLIQMKDFAAAEQELLAVEAAAGGAATSAQAVRIRGSLAKLYTAWEKPDRARAYAPRLTESASSRGRI